ncbi:uncharacterized protein LOC113202790 [Frankliniella occidentalis]|uniref:Uncharacterized protein LOC113202790 n=1 Tax=Frankliniella occidentalis TaxID=133901 RepID=A0A9C6X0R5_FRAOC|nr:uncharacterized protein LOC113202790 [Frankliniella occidentalis]
MDDEIDTKKKVKEIIGKRNVPKDITNFVEVSVALQEDLTNSFQSLKSRKEKGKLINCLQFENLQSVKGLSKGTQFLPRGARRKVQTKAKPNAAHRVNQAKVHEYWLSDLASTECPGKKQTMTIKKKKHQLRYMNASRKRLFKMFKNNNQDSTVKYGIFCKYKPAWIVRPKVSERDTCLCTSCENIKLKIAALHKHEIINENDADKALDSICCESGKVECLLRLCSQCVDKKLKVNEFEQNKFIDYEVWMSIQENRTNAKTKNDFTVKRTVLQTVTTSLQNLVNAVTTDIEEHAKHIGRHYHQYQAVKKKLDNLSNEVLVLKIDYSENYACKYSKEVQGVHFGASRNQVTIHTGVKYTKDCKQAFATVSPDLAHDATATMVHLQPILKAALKENPAVKELVICSDSPSTQYRNKTIFGLIIQHFGVEYPQLQRFSWNYSESGHGKGPADGVGAVLKRTADSLVMSNSNIDTFDKLVTELLNEENIQHVNIIPISANAINNFKKSYTGQDIQFQGTLKVHQVTWDRSKGDLLSFRELSCFECDYGSDCRHYHLGSKKFIAKEILSNNGVAGKKQANQTSSRGRSATKTTVSKSSEKAPTNCLKTMKTFRSADSRVCEGMGIAYDSHT